MVAFKEQMTKEIVQPIDELAEKLYDGSQRFYRATLSQLIAYKTYLGREVSRSPLYKQYGENLIEQLCEKTGLKHSTLYSAVQMYEKEKLSPPKEKKFIKEFSENYSSWNEYCRKSLMLKSPTVENSEAGCKQCKIHCP